MHFEKKPPQKHVTDQLIEHVAKKVKGNVPPHQIKSHLRIFVNCLIENPSFDSQTKERMKTQQSQFGSSCDFKKKFLDDVCNKTDIVDTVTLWANQKQNIDLARATKLSAKASRGKIHGIPKLEDANDAGGKHSEECTLILTEGDSAKALAVAGLSVVGRDKFGVFPLKGKLLNVRDAKRDAILKNEEVKNILKIMGLEPTKHYEDTTPLR
jgi:DNA topoisomerase II